MREPLATILSGQLTLDTSFDDLTNKTTNKMTFKLLLTLFLLTIFCAQTKAQSEFDKLKSELKENLKWFSSNLNYQEYESKRINIDSLATSTEKKLANLLVLKESTNLDLKEFPNLQISASTTDSLNIRFYTFSNLVGPTGYESVHTVIQWTNNKGKLFSYPIALKVSGKIVKIYKLKSTNSNLYLLLSSDYFTTIAYVIQIKGNYLNLDYPAFLNSPEISVNRMNVSFNKQTQVLTIDSYENYGVDEKTLLNMRVKVDKNLSYQKIIKQFDKQFEVSDSIKLKFDGLKFIH